VISRLPWLPLSLLWLHVLGATFWFGAFLTLTYLIRPSFSADEMAAQGERIMPRARRVIIPTILVVGITGLLLGTIFGPIRRPSDLVSTSYGVTWLASIMFGGLAFWPAKPAWMRRMHAEGIGFFGAFSAMILLHVGL
jgi:putative copper export protein